ncbi:hypothetical protein [Nocardia brasiliensis]|uniref:hypothetical protein n=1 Tax=Nocardia brasiliensis TaxID=37326 RepID=UPI002457DE23|nr:hypothetical protein [Nocardia brasiliensis]
MTDTGDLELITPMLRERSTAYLATELARHTGSSSVDTDYHRIIDILCERHPDVEAAWETWADANQDLPARNRVLAGTAILPVIRRLVAAHPDLNFTTAARYEDATGSVWEAHDGQWGYLGTDGAWHPLLNSISSINRLFGPLEDLSGAHPPARSLSGNRCSETEHPSERNPF